MNECIVCGQLAKRKYCSNACRQKHWDRLHPRRKLTIEKGASITVHQAFEAMNWYILHERQALEGLDGPRFLQLIFGANDMILVAGDAGDWRLEENG